MPSRTQPSCEWNIRMQAHPRGLEGIHQRPIFRAGLQCVAGFLVVQWPSTVRRKRWGENGGYFCVGHIFPSPPLYQQDTKSFRRKVQTTGGRMLKRLLYCLLPFWNYGASDYMEGELVYSRAPDVYIVAKVPVESMLRGLFGLWMEVKEE